jgi:hypothetical protein
VKKLAIYLPIDTKKFPIDDAEGIGSVIIGVLFKSKEIV